MTQKCVHKGCQKEFTDIEEPCYHHPGAPIFHEGQKGWQCCKPRVLTFDEFLAIPPCTQGKHSTTAPTLAPVQTSGPGAGGQKHNEVPAPSADGTEHYGTPKQVPQVTAATPTPQPKVEKPLEQDPADAAIPEDAKCKRLGCGATYSGGERKDEECTFHPGAPLFHEGSKGYTCCKRRVLEFDQFLKIEGCANNRHLFVGAPKSLEEEELVQCRNDFYQTYTDVIVSIFAKKVDKDNATIEFDERELRVDLPMPDKKRFKITYPLYGKIDPEKSEFKIMGTKVELKLKKADGTSWPTLRSDEATGEIIQIGKPATAT
ncbi:HSP20-like chaperone [Geopyxis carbonaria]|nr:HSP20-like chaperone [Geopyxis carbonaria]